MLKTYFVVSDIHSHYDSLITALNQKGYNEKNPSHHLIVLGDMFDRGDQTVSVLTYLYRLSNEQKATILLGNHDSFLLDFLNEEYHKAYFNMKYNGFDKTLLQLSNLDPKRTELSFIQDTIMTKFPYLKQWLSSLPYYIEIENYIFVHGGIDGSKLDWKTMSSRHDFVWSREVELPRVEDKIVVAGHHRVATIRKKTRDYHLLFLHSPELFDIMYLEGKILIDRFVEVSNEINVLTLELKA